MYLDGVVIAGLVTVVGVMLSLVYLGYYGYRRLRHEEEKMALKVQAGQAEKPRR